MFLPIHKNEAIDISVQRKLTFSDYNLMWVATYMTPQIETWDQWDGYILTGWLLNYCPEKCFTRYE